MWDLQRNPAEVSLVRDFQEQDYLNSLCSRKNTNMISKWIQEYTGISKIGKYWGLLFRYLHHDIIARKSDKLKLKLIEV